MLTRRLRGRTFLLRPSKRTSQIVAYVVTIIAARRNIQLHALVVMSNHWHVCLTDPGGAIVDFQRDYHQFIARGINAHHGEFESIWSSGSPSRVECEGADDLVERIAYTMANPVEAALVRHGHSWPGLRRAWPNRPWWLQNHLASFVAKTRVATGPHRPSSRSSVRLATTSSPIVSSPAWSRPPSTSASSTFVPSTTPRAEHSSAGVVCSSSRATPSPAAASREPRAASRSLGPGRVSQQVAAHRAPAGQQALARRLPSSHGRLV